MKTSSRRSTSSKISNLRFSATIQYNAEKRYPEFLFDRNNYTSQRQSGQQNNQLGKAQEAPKTFRGKELTDEQYKNLKEGQTVYVAGLMDKKGQPYQGYITFNKETGKTNFRFPSQVKAQAKPTEAYKTQTAVNSEGKTNEATKNIKEPLKPGQQRPKNEKQEKQQKVATPAKSQTPKKSRGRKI